MHVLGLHKWYDTGLVRPCVAVLAGPLFSQLASLRSFLRELRPLLGSVGTTAALTAVDELQALGQLLVDWGVHREQLLLEPLLTPQAEYFSGTLFQASTGVGRKWECVEGRGEVDVKAAVGLWRGCMHRWNGRVLTPAAVSRVV